MKRHSHYTAWAGVYAVAAELSRRGYDAALTVGNTPSTDLLCGGQNTGQAFRVEVKSLARPNFVLIQKRILEEAVRPDLFFVVVLVPISPSESLRYFVLTHAEVQQLWDKLPKVRKDGKPLRPGFEGINWGDVIQHESKWDKLPSIPSD